MSALILPNPKSAAVSEHQSDGAAGLCREALEEFWRLLTEGPLEPW